MDGYAGDGSVRPEAYLPEQERAFARLRGLTGSIRPWPPGGKSKPWTIGRRHNGRRRFGYVGPFYFAYPESSEARAHIARLRQNCRVNVEVMRVWERPPLSELDIRPLLPDIDCPTLVLVGEHDFVCRPSWAEPVARNIADAELVIFEDCDHIPQCEDPERSAMTVLGWC